MTYFLSRGTRFDSASAACCVQAGHLQGLDAQWFMESLNGGTFNEDASTTPDQASLFTPQVRSCGSCVAACMCLPHGWCADQHTSVGGVACSGSTTASGRLGAAAAAQDPLRAAGAHETEADGALSQHASTWGEGRTAASQAPGSEVSGIQTPRSIISGLERQPSSSTVKSVKFAGWWPAWWRHKIVRVRRERGPVAGPACCCAALWRASSQQDCFAVVRDRVGQPSMVPTVVVWRKRSCQQASAE